MTNGVLMDPAEAVRTAGRLLQSVFEVEPFAISGADAMALAVEFEGAQRSLDAARMHALLVLEASGECERLGHKTVAAWSAHAARLPTTVARQRTRMARRLQTMPLTASALLAGAIATQHVDVLMRANTKGRAALFAEHEGELVGFALSLSFRDFVTAIAYWRNQADPVDAADEAAKKCARRAVHSSRTLDGMGRVDAWLDPIGFAAFDTELARLTEIEFHRDWSDATATHGTATIDLLPRTAAQRRADALVEMATRSASTLPDARRPEPLVVIVTDVATVEAAAAHYANPLTPHPWPTSGQCRLENGTTVTADEMFEQLLLGRFRKLLLDSKGGVVDYGRSQRLFRGDLREAIRIRDGTCVFPGCELPARRCHTDHVRPWGDGGPTNGHNGRAYCGYHNLRRQRVEAVVFHEWRDERDPDTGHVNWTTPTEDDTNNADMTDNTDNASE
jgi:hypothetical protein